MKQKRWLYIITLLIFTIVLAACEPQEAPVMATEELPEVEDEELEEVEPTPMVMATEPAKEEPAETLPAEMEAAVTLNTNMEEDLGTYLVDSEGMSLYLFEADEPGAGSSACYDQCAEAWPPLTTADAVAAGDPAVDESLIGTFAREDGAMQVTYNGWPLYYFAQDEAPGDTEGQGIEGFGGTWYLVTAEDMALQGGG